MITLNARRIKFFIWGIMLGLILDRILTFILILLALVSWQFLINFAILFVLGIISIKLNEIQE